ncbi:pirin family protein [Rosenbergiella epipactidis]|uniref:pirin family protein n=1 Tax=Rosenbergiella epipactidis TaxID=1544694 RepID=UPI001F4E0C3B|nr:pirin family protein [Rosenbergiella epipactidis]
MSDKRVTTMLKIKNSSKHQLSSGGFGIDILWPGMVQNSDDSGIGGIGRIDHANVRSGTVISMHPHKDDEILTYMRKGRMLHLDTVGNEEEISDTRLMLMNAGHTFQHEERTLGEKDGSMQCLQIFIRPSESDLSPQVQFHDFGTPYSENNWRLIAGPDDAPLTFRSQTWVHDTRLSRSYELRLPVILISNMVRLLYVFEGAAKIGDIILNTGDSIIIEDNESRTVTALDTTDLVLFTTDPAGKFFSDGMFSGNIRPRL